MGPCGRYQYITTLAGKRSPKYLILVTPYTKYK